MSENTGIAYVHHSWNWHRGCRVMTCECRKDCWAKAVAKAMGWNFQVPHLLWGDEVWTRPLQWNEEARKAGGCFLVFNADLGDPFQDVEVVNRARPRMWEVVKATPHLMHYISTKVPENIQRFLPADWGASGYPNVILTVTVTSPKTYGRMDILRTIPARYRCVSVEPMWARMKDINLAGFDWVIVGGASGSNWQKGRMRLSWARELWEKCQAQQKALFFKQVASGRDERGIDALDRELFNGKAGQKLHTRQWPKFHLPLMPIHEKGARFEDADWEQYQLDSSPVEGEPGSTERNIAQLVVL